MPLNIGKKEGELFSMYIYYDLLTSLVFWVFKGRLLKRDCLKRQGVDLFEGREKQKVIFTKFPMNTQEGTHFPIRM